MKDDTDKVQLRFPEPLEVHVGLEVSRYSEFRLIHAIKVELGSQAPTIVGLDQPPNVILSNVYNNTATVRNILKIVFL